MSSFDMVSGSTQHLYPLCTHTYMCANDMYKHDVLCYEYGQNSWAFVHCTYVCSLVFPDLIGYKMNAAVYFKMHFLNWSTQKK